MNFKGIITAFSKGVTAHSTEILTGVGLLLEGKALWSVGKTAPKALSMIKDEEEKQGRSLTFKEKVKLTHKVWAPSALYSVASATCFVGSCAIGVKKNHALTAALSVNEATDILYREKVKEAVGERKEQKIREAVEEEKAKKEFKELKKEAPTQVSYISGSGPELFKETLTGQYFRSDSETVRRMANDANYGMINGGMYMSKNDWLQSYLGIDKVTDGEITGFNTDNRIDIWLDPVVGPDEKEVVHLIMHRNLPRSGYDGLH